MYIKCEYLFKCRNNATEYTLRLMHDADDHVLNMLNIKDTIGYLANFDIINTLLSKCIAN